MMMKKEILEEKGRLRKVVHTIGYIDAVITGTILVVISTQMIFAFWSYNYSSEPEIVFGKVVVVDKQHSKQHYYHGITGDYVELKTVGLFLDFVFTLSLFVLLLVDCNLVKATEKNVDAAEAENSVKTWLMSNLFLTIVILPVTFTSGLIISSMQAARYQGHVSADDLGAALLGIPVYLAVRFFCEFIVLAYLCTMIPNTTKDKDSGKDTSGSDSDYDLV